MAAVNNEPLLALRNARVRYPGAFEPVLENLDFELCTGQRVGLVGPNGSGKTSLLLTLVGLVSLDQGELLFQGRAVRTKADIAALRRTVGLVFQNPDDQLFSPTVLEDVAFGPLNLGCSQAEALERSLVLLHELNLAHLAHRQPHTLSGGQKRLISLAVVLVMQPSVLLLDEPTNDLDTRSRELVGRILANSSCTMVVASHDQALLASLTLRQFAMPAAS
ncbi:MAG TPA: ABC transporter ATP-binding protein [Desulfonatronum sp.]|nr:ABC transporter ATP-binding protein [Desulfonatronum sp.]